MISEQAALQARAREDLCRFLSACFYEPSSAFGEERLFDSIVAAAMQVESAWADLARAMAAAYGDAAAEELLVDYTRLFLGPVTPRASPYGSSWLAGEPGLMQESTLAVEALYREAGFDVDDGIQDLPDHIAIELEFLYVLMFRENEARRRGSAAELAAATALIRRFLGEHLGKWVTPFAAAIKDGAETRFYAALAQLLEQFIQNEARLRYSA